MSQEPVLTETEKELIKGRIRSEKINDELYLRAHPEIKQILSQLYRGMLISKPIDPRVYISQFFERYELDNLKQ